MYAYISRKVQLLDLLFLETHSMPAPVMKSNVWVLPHGSLHTDTSNVFRDICQ